MKTLMLLAGFAGILYGTGCARGAELEFILDCQQLLGTASRGENRELLCRQVSEPPRVDGRLDDPCWQRCEPQTGFLDFGIVGRFEGSRRKLASDFLVKTAARDFVGLAQCMVEMGNATGVDMERLGTDLEGAMSPLLDPSVPAKYADLLPVITRVTLRHRMPLPRDFVLILKQMVYFDRYAKLLAPSLNIFSDPRILSALMEDMVLAQATPEPAFA